MPPTSPVPTQRSFGWRLVLLIAATVGLFLLCAGVVVAAVRASNGAPTLSVQAEPTPQGAKVSLRGDGWPPSTALRISASPPPGEAKALDLGTATSSASGALRATKLTPCTTRDPVDAKTMLTVTVRAGEVVADARVAAASWVCM
jgi:hypothetical protein